MRSAIVFSTASLCLLAAFVGFRLGQQKLHFSEATGVIESVARNHVETRGGTLSDCLGWLTDSGRSLNVRCGDSVYQVDQLGRIERVEEGGI